MRLALIIIPIKSGNKLRVLSTALFNSVKQQGYNIDLFEVKKNNIPQVSFYDYLIVGSQAVSLFGRIEPCVTKILAQAGNLVGKRGMAYIIKSSLRPQKALLRLMSAMEKSGILVNDSHCITSLSQVNGIAAHLTPNRES